jgi:hypothetical protein
VPWILLYYIQELLVFLILKECSGILWATVILDGNLMHISFIYTCISKLHILNLIPSFSRGVPWNADAIVRGVRVKG